MTFGKLVIVHIGEEPSERSEVVPAVGVRIDFVPVPLMLTFCQKCFESTDTFLRRSSPSSSSSSSKSQRFGTC